MFDFASEYYSSPRLSAYDLRNRIEYYQAQLPDMKPEGRAIVRWKIKQWERCIA